MFNRIEIFGFAFSVAVMALALYLVTVQSFFSPALEESEQAAAGLVAVDRSTANQNSARTDALRSAYNERGQNLERLVVDDITIGSGQAVEIGDTVTVHYIGTLQNGQEFDNSHKRGTPFTFTVGKGRVIAGWEEGIVGMQVGGQRILVIPADKAYGQSGYGPIPGGATLVFAIELLAIN